MNLLLPIAFFGIVLVLALVVSRSRLRRQIDQAKRKGLYPVTGESPTIEHVRTLVKAGHKIPAIKLYRELHAGIGLKEAKDEVEKLARE